MIKEAVRAAIGIPVSGITQKNYNGYWAEIVLHSDKEGIFERLWIADEIKKNVVEEKVKISAGMKVRAFSAANEAIGTLILKFDTRDQMEIVLSDTGKYVSVIVR